MNIAPTPNHVPASAHFSGSQALVRALVLGCAISCAGLPAFAGQERERDGRSNTQQQQQQPNRDMPPPRAERSAPPQQQPQPPQPPQQQRADPRQADAHAYEEQRRQAQQQDQGSRRGGRLTADERRELRRQINEAGVELYPNAPRR